MFNVCSQTKRVWRVFETRKKVSGFLFPTPDLVFFFFLSLSLISLFFNDDFQYICAFDCLLAQFIFFNILSFIFSYHLPSSNVFVMHFWKYISTVAFVWCLILTLQGKHLWLVSSKHFSFPLNDDCLMCECFSFQSLSDSYLSVCSAFLASFPSCLFSPSLSFSLSLSAHVLYLPV